MTTTHSLARLMYDTNAALDAAERELRVADYADPAVSATIDAHTAMLVRLRRLASLCRRACGLARAGDSVVLVAPVGTSPDEVAGGLADEGSGEWRERVEVVTASDAAEWERLYAAARQRAGVEVVS